MGGCPRIYRALLRVEALACWSHSSTVCAPAIRRMCIHRHNAARASQQRIHKNKTLFYRYLIVRNGPIKCTVHKKNERGTNNNNNNNNMEKGKICTKSSKHYAKYMWSVVPWQILWIIMTPNVESLSWHVSHVFMMWHIKKDTINFHFWLFFFRYRWQCKLYGLRTKHFTILIWALVKGGSIEVN